jgi:Flp pilus assembly protein TadG
VIDSISIGAGIDYGHAISVRIALQAALDSSALMLSKKATCVTSGQLQTLAQNYVTALFNRPEATNLSVTATYTTDGGSQVLVSGSADVATNFMQVMGFHKLNVTGQATAKWGFTRLRVALVLDNTGSMRIAAKWVRLRPQQTIC